ncbi:MAG: C1 family peptidase [Planctomycetota bacterium]
MTLSRWLSFSLVFAMSVAAAIPAVAGPYLQETETAQARSQSEPEEARYEFTVESEVECTEVKSQGQTGTCWCFATASFLESEMLRRGKGQLNLSEMFIVKGIYQDKAMNYVLRQGNANFSQGALAHDFINGVHRHGLMPEEAYDGLDEGVSMHNHSEMESLLASMVEAVVERSRPTPKWRVAFDRVLDTYMGETPENFQYDGQSYTPKEFAEFLDFRKDDYVNITSFTHHPFYEEFVLEIPDNYSNGSFYNMPIDDIVAIIDHAIENGYSVAWDGDVSESGFSQSRGLAVLPDDPQARPFNKPVEQMEVTQEMRQATFYDFTTTDDHLMHLTGIARDTAGNKYYMIKNSWGDTGPYGGHLYMSEAYVRLKTISILLHRDGMPEQHKMAGR